MIGNIIKILIQILLAAALSPLINGIIKKVKATVQHRKGVPVFQMYYDLAKLFKKDMVISKNSSWIFGITPYVYLISALIAAAFIPALPQLFSFSFVGDAIFVVYLLALGRFFLVLSGLDTGSTFGGMGSSREMMISSLIEPAFMVAVFTLALNPAVASTNFKNIYGGSQALGWGIVSPVYILLSGAMFIILIAETARIPIDDPATHLELTMVHEAMTLEYSGRYLAFVELGSAVKQLVYITIIANVFLPFGVVQGFGKGMMVSLAFYIVKIIGIAVIIAFIEINTVKLRLFSVPNMAALAFILSMLAFMSGFVFGR